MTPSCPGHRKPRSSYLRGFCQTTSLIQNLAVCAINSAEVGNANSTSASSSERAAPSASPTHVYCKALTSSAPSTSGRSTSSSPPMLFIISEKRSKLDMSSSESSSQSFQLLKSTLSQLSFALSFVSLGHAWPDSPFRKQHKIDLSVLLCFDSFGSILLKRSISFKCLKLSLPPRQLNVSLDFSKFTLTSLLSSTQNSIKT